MIKLLIVDDEPLVQIGIKSMLNWADYGIEVCGTAMNGEAALKLIEEYSPEIVITDIKMPIMNGLDLVKHSRERYGAIPLFLILTSFEEFQLVRQALSYQVVDYLIKLELDGPILAEAIERAKIRLAELKASEESNLSDSRPLMQSYLDKFLIRLLHNLFDSRKQFELQVRDLNLDFSSPWYLAAHGQITSERSASLSLAQQETLYTGSLQMVTEILGRHLPCYVLSLDKQYFAVIFYSLDDPRSIQDQMIKAWDNVRTMLHNYFSVLLHTGIGAPVSDPLQIGESYQDARQAFKQTSGQQPICFAPGLTTQTTGEAFNLSLFKTAITQAFEEFDTEVLYDTLTEITKLFAANPMHRVQAMDGACNILYLSLSLLPGGEEILEEIFADFQDGYRCLYRRKTVEQINEWLLFLRDQLCQVLKNQRRTYKDHVVMNVQNYINNHIEERISLNDVAAVFGISPNYLSALFKRACNIGFSEYIAQRKILRAKMLLLDESKKVYEVADQLGFESAFYFSKVFKKVEGQSPRDFIRTHSADAFPE